MPANSFVTGKGNLLDHMRDIREDIPGKYQRIGHEELDKSGLADGSMARIGGHLFLIRSDSTIEDSVIGNRVATFAGLFGTYSASTENPNDITFQGIADPLYLAKKDLDHVRDFMQRIALKRSEDYETIRKQLKGQDDEEAMKRIADMQKIKDISLAQSRDDRFIADLAENLRADLEDVWLGDVVKPFPADKALGSAERIRRYAGFREVDLKDAQMNYIIHKMYLGRTVLLAEHPNIEGMIHIEDTYGTYCKDVYRNMLGMLSGTLEDVARDFVMVVDQLRDKGVISPDLAYMGEAKDEKRKIVQLRPYFPRIIHPKGNEKILGTIPDEGIFFTRDSLSERYRGLLCYKNLRDIRFDTEEELPSDVETSVPTRVIMIQKPEHNQYLSHAGLRTIEAVTSLDMSGTSYSEYEKVKDAREIRYFEDRHGIRHFEVIRQ